VAFCGHVAGGRSVGRAGQGASKAASQ
jgi:hypothetical protein